MKILVNCTVPFALAHGGLTIQIQQTMSALSAVGVEIEPLRWWDSKQKGDLIHHFGIASNYFLDIARTSGMPVVMTNLFSETCNRSDARLRRQGRLIQAALKVPVGRQIKNQLNWGTYTNATHNIVGLDREKYVLRTVYRVPDDKISVVPLGLTQAFLNAGPGKHQASSLICVGTIYAVKHSVELAKLAQAAKIPILFVGKPYSKDDGYWQGFKKLIDERWVKYQPHVENEAEVISLLQAARGFVLMSQFENWSLSSHEAIACGLPLLVQDQKWSRERFGNQVRYFKSIGYSPENVAILKQFYDEAPGLPAPDIKLYSWAEVATQLKAVYQTVLDRKP